MPRAKRATATVAPAATAGHDRPDARRGAVPDTTDGTDTAIDVRHVDAAGGVIISVVGDLGHDATAALGRHVHTALDGDPTVVVVNLRRVRSRDHICAEVLAAARERAHAAGIALHVVEPDGGHRPADQPAAHLVPSARRRARKV